MKELHRLRMILLLAGSSYMLAASADATQFACGSHQEIQLENGFKLANNNWGSEGHPESPFSCVFLNPDGTIGWFWDRPETGHLPDFPEIMHGPKPFGGGTGHTDLLPIEVKNLNSMRMWRDGHHVTPGSTGPWSHTISLWFTENVPHGHNPDHITHEIMINVATAGYYGGDGSGTTQPYAINDGHAQYHHQESFPMGHWRIHIFRQADQQKPLPKEVDIKPFIDYLVQNESLTGDDWLASWELGDEMNDHTQGDVHLTTLALEVNGIQRSPRAELVPTPGNGAPVPDGTYTLKNRQNARVADVEAMGTGDGANVHLWDWHGGTNQRWDVTHLGGNQYSIIGVGSGKAIDVEAASTADWANIHIWTYFGGDNQKWIVEPTDGGYHRLVAVHSGKVLDASGGDNGSNIHHFTWHGGANQQWAFQAP